MIIPVRCFTCGKVVGSAYPEYVSRKNMGENPKDILDSLGFDRYCCRRMIVAHADLIGEIAPLG
ncbi:MAG: DNA-directed RNA polymerase subunit N [Candidatus Methanomethylophilaceae archaeon]|nr:DNA-directed RNA polymerase subunit N [Candidatus Methanomethylophilaceae archaeon]